MPEHSTAVHRQKQQVRDEVLRRRSERDAADRAAAGEALAAAMLARPLPGPLVAAYASVGNEPPTTPLLDALRDAGAVVLLPVVVGDDLDWAEYAGPSALVAGPHGLLQPTAERRGPDAIATVDLCLLPALAVDRRGVRLGRGRGYYDRALSTVEGELVAVVYDDELVDELPAEPHDVAVSGVLRPAGYQTLISGPR